jgi:23S rRNA (uridine2552-2'-O)-methyltransferase
VSYQRKDAHYRRAKAQGFRARSAYKLAELADRHQLLRKGDHVVDLGAWPGGWLQVALERVGPSGRLVGVDLMPIEPLPASNVVCLVGDVRDPGVRDRILDRLGGAADVVLSDVAPKLTGVRDVDEARCAEAFAATMSALPALLRPGGRALVKLFMDAEYREHTARLRTLFDEVTSTRPEASRRGSAELYAIGRGFSAHGAPVDKL